MFQILFTLVTENTTRVDLKEFFRPCLHRKFLLHSECHYDFVALCLAVVILFQTKLVRVNLCLSALSHQPHYVLRDNHLHHLACHQSQVKEGPIVPTLRLRFATIDRW